MDNLELSPYCLSVVDCSSDDLRNALLSIVDVGTAITEGMAAKLVAFKEDLAGQFDALFSSDRRSVDCRFCCEAEGNFVRAMNAADSAEICDFFAN